MNYGWMAFSLVFGVLGHLFRGWRWNLTLAPLGEYPKVSNSVYAVFVSYAANLVVPRVGEVSRCGILSKYDGVSFSKSLGTVVTERLIDTICVLLITVVTQLLQSRGTHALCAEALGEGVAGWKGRSVHSRRKTSAEAVRTIRPWSG